MPEDTPSESRSGHSGAWWMLWSIFILTVVYPLSTGPVIIICERTGVDSDYVELIYAPLIYLYDNSILVQQAFDWYLELWGV